MTVKWWKGARGHVWLQRRRCVNGSGRAAQAPSEDADRSLSAVWEVEAALRHRRDVVKHIGDRRDSKTGREGDPAGWTGTRGRGIMAPLTLSLSLIALALLNAHLSRASNRHAVYWNSSNPL